MRKVIKGKTYNTQTSKVLAKWDNGLDPTKIGYVSQTLYMNSKRVYFLHEERTESTLSRLHTERIIPLNSEDAAQWAQTHLSTEKYDVLMETSFGGTHKTGRESVLYTLDSEMLSSFRGYAESIGGNMSRMVERAIIAMYGEEMKKHR